MIICLIGKMRHGKDSTADIMTNVIEKEYGLTVNRLALAQPLKVEALKYTGLYSVKELDDYKNRQCKVSGIDIRLLLQQLGDTATAKDKYCYCNKLIDRIRDNKKADITIVTDVRIANEYEYFKRMRNVVFVKIVRNIESDDSVVNRHKSEVDVVNMHGDYNIYNDDKDDYIKDVINVTNILMDDYLDGKKSLLNMLLPTYSRRLFSKGVV